MSHTAFSLRVFADTGSLAAAAAEEFCGRVIHARDQGNIFSCALSGGSTPRILFRQLSDPGVLARLPAGFWNSVHFFWGDERDVPPDHPDNNYRVAQETLLARIEIPARNIHRIRPESGGALKAAAEYEMELKRFFGIQEGKLPRFDLIFLGMGDDGHTASLFPYSDAAKDRTHLVAAPWIEKLHSFRITLTLPVINNAACIIFLISGQSKADILCQVLRQGWVPELLPAQAVRPNTGELLWLVDRAAASKLPANADAS
jgi:6-phosphogluconolactonase